MEHLLGMLCKTALRTPSRDPLPIHVLKPCYSNLVAYANLVDYLARLAGISSSESNLELEWFHGSQEVVVFL